MICYGQHGFSPNIGRDTAAGHAFERSVVIIAHPDANDEIRGKANKPGIPCRLGGSGFTGNFNAVNLSALPGARLDHLMHHKCELLGGLGANNAFANTTSAARQGLTFSQKPKRRDAIGLNRYAAVEDARIGTGHFDQGAFGGAKGQSGPICKRILQAEIPGNFLNDIAADVFGNLHSWNIERLG